MSTAFFVLGFTTTRQLYKNSTFVINQIWNKNGSLSTFSTSILTRSSSSFESAVDRLSSVKQIGKDKKLELYALYMQASVGINTTERPDIMDIVGKAKWDAWNGLGKMNHDEAKQSYVDIVDSLIKGQNDKAQVKVTEGPGILVTVKDGICTILMNRPEKYNALTTEMYDRIAGALTEANADDSTKIIVLTGIGKFFCSGMDLGKFTNATDVAKMAKETQEHLLSYVSAFIECKKPLIALVNGPAIGISVTTLALCDAVYCTDKATFTCPFSSLGQSPEGCSSYTFPRIMGYAKASELLFFNNKITAEEAEHQGLVSKVFPDETFQNEAWAKVKLISKFPVNSLTYSKELVRGKERQILHDVNKAECDSLFKLSKSEDCMNAVMKFLSRKSRA